ncbi:MAG: sulfite exporter TauE/SafE family protein, partial [Candidatus Thermoplasmatota archaeon]|nr:sulfite exporter TauE/SafE family protein [Candidatus Thermoplasmatota archaeon]
MTLALTIIIGILIGLFTGVCSGLFGIGGGLVSIPLMHVVLGIPGEVAIGTSLFLIIPTTLSGALVYSKKKMVDAKTGLICGVAGIPTAMLGAYLSNILSGKILMLTFSALLIGIGIKMLLQKKKSAGNGEAHKIDAKYVAIASVIGASVGFISGLLGIGGGFLLIPAFLMILGLSMHEAIGTSLLSIAIYGIPGAITHA